MHRVIINCVDCGVEVPRSGGRGRPRVRCEQHFAAFAAAKAAKKLQRMMQNGAAAAAIRHEADVMSPVAAY